MSLGNLGWKIHAHLKQHRPKMFRELKKQGKLNQYLKSLENRASGQLISLEESGLAPFEAWEIVSRDVLLPSEEDVPNVGETMQPYQD
jgi:hypothetical protein